MLRKGEIIQKHAPLTLDAEIAPGDTIYQIVKFVKANEVELKAIGDNIPDGYVAGWASTPDLDTYHHVVERGAFSEAIQKRGLEGPKGIKFLHGHNWEKIIGAIKVLEYRGDRLWIEAQLNLNISYARDLYEALKMQGGMSFSVGFFLEDYSFKTNADEVEYLNISRGDLFEVSIVPFPGNEDCTMEFVKGKGTPEPKTIAEFEKALVALGYAKSRNDAQRLTALVKRCSSLFYTAPAAIEPPLPVLAKEAFESAFDKLAEMKALLLKKD